MDPLPGGEEVEQRKSNIWQVTIEPGSGPFPDVPSAEPELSDRPDGGGNRFG
jgi:hypothetical protein